MSEMVVDSAFAVVNAVGLVAFALVGATKGIRAGFDPFGVVVVGLVTAFGGGTTRDILVDRIPLSVQTASNLSYGLLGVVLAVGLALVISDPDRHPATQFADAAGLGAFAATGSIVATDAGLSAFGVVAIATINAVGGGALTDLLLDRSPFVLLEDIYAIPAVLGGMSYVAVTGLGLRGATVACVAVTVGTRLLAVSRGWDLPPMKELLA